MQRGVRDLVKVWEGISKALLKHWQKKKGAAKKVQKRESTRLKRKGESARMKGTWTKNKNEENKDKERASDGIKARKHFVV